MPRGDQVQCDRGHALKILRLGNQFFQTRSPDVLNELDGLVQEAKSCEVLTKEERSKAWKTQQEETERRAAEIRKTHEKKSESGSEGESESEKPEPRKKARRGKGATDSD